ncbi:MAG: hypothetical protein ACHQQ3_08665 [Gemmatimonadales bacterium]
MLRSFRTSFGTSLIALAFVPGCARNALTSMTRGYDARVADGVSRLRTATAAFHSIDSAVTAGYPRELPECLIHAQHGAMGYHHLNRALVDAKLEIDRPEILLYERRPNGEYRLNGVEFIVPFRAWPRDSVAPVLMGQTLHREDNLKIWYLHVWAWTKNPEGLFANFNPDVACLNGTGKVYTPFEAP